MLKIHVQKKTCARALLVKSENSNCIRKRDSWDLETKLMFVFRAKVKHKNYKSIHA